MRPCSTQREVLTGGSNHPAAESSSYPGYKITLKSNSCVAFRVQLFSQLLPFWRPEFFLSIPSQHAQHTDKTQTTSVLHFFQVFLSVPPYTSK